MTGIVGFVAFLVKYPSNFNQIVVSSTYHLDAFDIISLSLSLSLRLRQILRIRIN